MPNAMNLEDYQISATQGFLPFEPPLEKLPSYYEAWETICSNLYTLRINGWLEDKVARLLMLETKHLISEPQWQRAYVLLGFIMNAYIWGPKEPLEVGLLL